MAWFGFWGWALLVLVGVVLVRVVLVRVVLVRVVLALVGGVTLDMPFGQMYSGCADYGRLHES